MFDPEKEIPSLELCKKLKELGYSQDKYGFYWVRLRGNLVNENEWVLIYWDKGHIRWGEKGNYILLGGCDCCADYLDIIEKIKAPTVRELEEWLFKVDLQNYSVSIRFDIMANRRYVEVYFFKKKFNLYDGLQSFEAYDFENIANILAKMLIWLIGKGYVNFKK